MRTILAVALLAVASPAAGHSWYDYACCSEHDCRQTTLGEVERRDNGWYVVPTGDLIPFDDQRVRHSMDPLIHVCLRKRQITDPISLNPAGPQSGLTIRCLYVPDVPT